MALRRGRRYDRDEQQHHNQRGAAECGQPYHPLAPTKHFLLVPWIEPVQHFASLLLLL